MAEPVVHAETQLAVCVELMRGLLQSTVEDALPQSTLDTDEGLYAASSSAVTPDMAPDTLQQRLEWERGRESTRIHTRVMQLQKQMNALKACVVTLGSGVAPTDGRYVDIPTATLDEEIARLGAENSRLATLMISLYDEAAAACATLESELLSVQVPSL